MEKDLTRIERRLDKMEADNRELVRIATVLEQQVEINKEQAEVLKKMNDNLTNLNSRFPNLEDKVDELEEKVEEMVVKGSLSFDEVMKKGFWIIFTAALTGILVYFGF